MGICINLIIYLLIFFIQSGKLYQWILYINCLSLVNKLPPAEIYI